MKLKNKAERERFLDEYTKLELFKEVPELNLRFFRYIFPNGHAIVATEYQALRFSDFRCNKCIYTHQPEVKHCLIIPNPDEHIDGQLDGVYKYYSPDGVSHSLLLKYLSDTNPDIQL